MITILVGDVLARLRRMPDSCVDCVVTSPPYWGLRDYDVAGQIGMEATLGEHLDVLVGVFREIRRVLKPHGTVWLNYGDCYASTPNSRPAAEVVGDDRTFRDKPFSTIGPIYRPAAVSRGRFQSTGGISQTEGAGRVVAGGVLKPKDLCMIPNRLAIALQDDGWWVRSEIIWNKTNPKPESIADRPAAVHEKIWLLTKSETYFYDADALKEPVTGTAKPRRKDGQWQPAKGETAGQRRAGTWVGTHMPDLRNGRNVWTFQIEGFREAHFATFPRELARRCMLAGTPRSVCGACGAVDSCGGLCGHFERQPGHVLDPFGGSGTVGLVARQLGLRATLIELNPAYAEMARRRIFGSEAA